MSAAAWIAVGLLGGLAAGVRFVLDSEISLRVVGPFPAGILAVNLLGALALGALSAPQSEPVSPGSTSVCPCSPASWPWR